MSTWVTPKTNWTSSDYFNIADYSRIVGNIEHIKDLANLMYSQINLSPVESSKQYTSMFYAEEMNAIEQNLERVNLGSYSFDIGTTKTYYVNDIVPDYNEFNRIESATLKLYNTLKSQYDLQPHLAFTLGGGKQFRVPRA